MGLLLGVVFLATSACSWDKKEDKIDENGPIKVQLPVYTEGTYRMEVVQLFSLKSLADIRGEAAKFLLDATSADGKLQGRNPYIRYMRDSNDVIIAQDDLSLQLLTVYAHMEKLRALDESSGAKDVLSYPRTIAVNAKFRSSEGIMENNALYAGQYDALLVVPYTKSSLPLMANAGVIGHEHFHALFQKLVIEPLKDRYPDPNHPTLHSPEVLGQEMGLTMISRSTRGALKSDPRTQYHAALMRAVNEGFADLWGWIYSGDNSFVGRSLPSEKINRELEIVPDKLDDKDELLGPINLGDSEDEILALSYRMGTELARALRNFANMHAKSQNISTDEVRPRMAQALMAALPALQKKFEALKKDEYLTLSQVAELFSEQVKDMKSDECYFLAKLMPGDEEKSMKMGDKCKGIEALEKGTGAAPATDPSKERSKDPACEPAKDSSKKRIEEPCPGAPKNPVKEDKP
jgi:hypothetical protein